MCKKFLKNRKNLTNCQIKKGNKFSGCNFFTIILAGLLVASSLTYLWLINKQSIMGYETASLEKKISLLKDENQKLNLNLVELQEINLVKEKAEKMQMAVVEEVEYLSTTDDNLAVKY